VNERVNNFDPRDRETAAVALAGGGILAFAIGWIVKSRLLRLIGLLASLAGGGLYARTKVEERGEKIDAAETTIRSTLDDLDPVARAQVLIDLAGS
jgi:hypothetical protein